MQYHIESIHMDKKNFACHICGRGFTRYIKKYISKNSLYFSIMVVLYLYKVVILFNFSIFHFRMQRLREHSARMHGDGLVPPSHSCSECGRDFITSGMFRTYTGCIDTKCKKYMDYEPICFLYFASEHPEHTLPKKLI